MEKQKYTVTEKAGPRVAGVRNPGKGKTLQLTEEQARYALIAGELERPSEKQPPSKSGLKTPSKAD